jgi:polysaccharide export outer membrane protein
MKLSIRALRWGAAGLFLLMLRTPADADPYVIGPEDVLDISVWEHPELSMTTRVDQEGFLVLPPIGDVRASGKTPNDLARHLEDVLQTFLRQRVQVTVTVTGYNSRRIHVTGAVGLPGRYSFAKIPQLLEVLGTAGGPSPTADLARVRVLHTEEGETTSVTVDLDRALQTGDLSSLPVLRSGDVVYVPSRAEQAGLAVPGDQGVAYVLGAVARPGAVHVGDGLALTRLMAVVGGTVPGADLHEIRIAAENEDGAGPWMIVADLEELLESGDEGPPVRAGELVFVPPRNQGPFNIARGAFFEVMGVSRDLLNLVVIGDYLSGR